MLAGEKVFQSLPPGSQADGPMVRTPARYVHPGFDGGGWHGPAVTLTFTSTGSAASVFSFYERRVGTLAWTATGSRNVLHYPQVWTKPYPRGANAYLSLTDLDIHNHRPGGSRYVLNASA
jgi:hypothetical protein